MSDQQAAVARLEEKLASMRDRERKTRTRRLIQLGGLVAKAMLETWPEETLYGALLSIQASKENPVALQNFAAAGRAAFERDKNRPQKIGATAQFTRRLPKDQTNRLRTLGFRWQAVLGLWAGKVYEVEASKVVGEFGGEFTLVQHDPEGAGGPDDEAKSVSA